MISRRTQAIEAAAAEIISMLKFVSENSADVRLGLMKLLDRMASDDEETAIRQMNWYVGTVINNFDEWPGPVTLRGVFCVKYKPRDGVEADLPPCRLASKIEERALLTHEEKKQIPLPAANLLKGLLPPEVRK